MYSRDDGSGSMLVTFYTNYREIYVVKDAKFIVSYEAGRRIVCRGWRSTMSSSSYTSATRA